jgi:BlaI family penicillinase repressor
MSKKDYELTEGEWTILTTVWENEPCAAPSVQEELAGRKNWTYSTVKTMMDRMVSKGLLKKERIRNLFLYRSAITRKQAQNGEIMRTVKRAFNGAFSPMMQFLLDNDTLSQQQLSELEILIKKKRVQLHGDNTPGTKK